MMDKVYIIMVEYNGEDLCFVSSGYNMCNMLDLNLSPIRCKGKQYLRKETAYQVCSEFVKNGHKAWVEEYYTFI